MPKTKRTSKVKNKSKLNSTNAMLFITASGLIYLLYNIPKHTDFFVKNEHKENPDNFEHHHPPLDQDSINEAIQREINNPSSPTTLTTPTAQIVLLEKQKPSERRKTFRNLNDEFDSMANEPNTVFYKFGRKNKKSKRRIRKRSNK